MSTYENKQNSSKQKKTPAENRAPQSENKNPSCGTDKQPQNKAPSNKAPTDCN